MKINGSIARKALKDLEEKGLIKKVVSHARLNVYSEFPLDRIVGIPWLTSTQQELLAPSSAEIVIDGGRSVELNDNFTVLMVNGLSHPSSYVVLETMLERETIKTTRLCTYNTMI